MIYIGTILYGYCGGYFGRDSYGTKRVEAIGADWVVVREESGMADFATFDSTKKMEEKILQWSSEEAKIRWEE